MGTVAFAAAGRFWRGNIHTHSTRSDGKLEPAQVCRLYREAGYDFLCLSDHFLQKYAFPIVDTIPFRTNTFATILGAELHAPSNSLGEAWHILAAGLPADFEPTGANETGIDLAARARAAGGFVGIAHPLWSGLGVEDGLAMMGRAHAVEIYNHGCALECTRGDGTYLLDPLLNHGHRITAYAADDAHFRFEDGFGGWMMVKAEANEPGALVAAMKAGHYYSSQGPVIRAFSVANGEATIECSPVRNVALVGRGTRAVHESGNDISVASLSIERFAADWFRLVITDSAGRSAWSNPVWL